MNDLAIGGDHEAAFSKYLKDGQGSGAIDVGKIEFNVQVLTAVWCGVVWSGVVRCASHGSLMRLQLIWMSLLTKNFVRNIYFFRGWGTKIMWFMDFGFERVNSVCRDIINITDTLAHVFFFFVLVPC